MSKANIINGICGGYTNSNVSKVCRSISCNFVPETQSSEASSRMILRSVCGSEVFCEMPEKNCRGIFRVSRGYTGAPVLYAVFGGSLYLIKEDKTCFKIGNVSNGVTEPVSMCETQGYGDNHPHLVIADGAQLHAVDTTLQPGDQAAYYRAIDLPQRAGSTEELIRPTHVEYLYSYLVVLDSGSDAFYLSYQYPFEILDEDTNEVNWDILQVEKYAGKGFAVYSEWSADITRALIKAGSFLYTFGDRSYQIFSYMNDVEYPFQSPDTAGGAIGIKAPRSCVAVGNAVFWLGASDMGENGVWMLNGNQISRVSTGDIEREIEALVNPQDAVGQTWQERGHIYYALTFRQSNRTFVYDTSEKLWHTRATYDQSAPNNEGAWRPQYAHLAYSKLIFGTLRDKYLICQADNKWTEFDGKPIVRRRVSGIITDGFSPFYCDSLKLLSNVGQFSLNEVYGTGVHAPDAGLEPKVSLRYSWDGGMTWSQQELAMAGPIGRYDWQLEWYGLGMGELLSVEISTSDPWPMAIVSAKIQGEPIAIL